MTPEHATPRPARAGATPRRRVLLAVAAAAALAASGCEWPPELADNPAAIAALGGGSVAGRAPTVVPDHGHGGVLADRVYVEARARRAADGTVEVGARVNATGLAWTPERRLFYYDVAPVGEWWTSSPIGPASAGISTVRIRARRLDSGRIELALLTPASIEVRPRDPQLAYADLTADDWSYTTPVVLNAAGEPAAPPPIREADHGGFMEISVSDSEACGLRAGGTVECWRAAPTWWTAEGVSAVLEGSFVALSAPCALRAEGDIACARPVEGNPERLGPFVALSDGQPRCGIRPDGRIDCWRPVLGELFGNDGHEELHPFPAPAGSFSAVSVGRDHACAIGLGGTLQCWGVVPSLSGWSGDESDVSHRYAGGPATPRGTFAAVSSGKDHTCVIRADGSVACWGSNREKQSAPPDGVFAAIEAGAEHTCGLRLDGTIDCWGGRGQLVAPYPENEPAPAPPGAFAGLGGRGFGVCGVRINGAVVCWGRSVGGMTPSAETSGRVHFDFDAFRPDDRITVTYDITHRPGGRFRALSAGERHACAVRADRSVTCWGLDLHGQSAPPAGAAFDTVSSGGYHTCGLHPDGAVACWGDNTHGQVEAPLGKFAIVDAGWRHTCAIGTDGSAMCWGDDSHGQTAAPAGRYTTVAAGGRHTCAINTDGVIACWGDDAHGQTTAPTGAFSAVTAGSLHTCALRPDGGVYCWGADHYGQSTAPRGTFSAVAAGADYTCGVRPGGEVDCWGARRGFGGGPPRAPATPPPAGPFTAVAAGSHIACGLRPDQTAECWTATGHRQAATEVRSAARGPVGAFTALSAGAHHTCAISTAGTVHCWGENAHAQTASPLGTYEHVASGDRHSCALDSAGSVECWGENTFGQAAAPPGKYHTLAAGPYHTCALNADGHAACWGDNTYAQATPPPGSYTALAVGERHSCALDTVGHIVCWGDNTVEQAAPSDGTYTALTAGRLHTCALRTSGDADCWGLGYDHDDTSPHDNETPTTPPQGPFNAISAGARHTCALDTTGNVECWPRRGDRGGVYHEYPLGIDDYYYVGYYWNTWKDSRATPLPGPFTAISAGTYHTCGIRPDRSIDCWSANEPRGPQDAAGAPEVPTQ
ncbi:MAG: hypothetical protein OXG47_08255 [bacterium]|nr:hypothetical protein [bacterium]